MVDEPASAGLNNSDFDEGPDTASAPPAPPFPSSKVPPKDFGDYQFIELLGKGAFGAVFKVWSLSKSRYEAMKIVETRGRPATQLLDAFKLEVQRMANVPGMQVAHVYHTGELPDGRPFFTMEYLAGGRLDRYCAKSRLSIDDRLRLMADVCDGVHRLHERKLIHCDLKPGNILISDDAGPAIPKMVDFGLARHLGFRVAPTRSAAGTLPYMSPEQLESKTEDPESGWDIYALGVTLYELLVGECPIDPLSDPIPRFDLAAERVRRAPIPPLHEKLSSSSRARSDELARERRLTADALRKRLADPWLEAVVDKALAKNRDERFATAADMGQNLRAYLRGRRPPIVPARPRDRVIELLRDHWLAISASTTLLIVAGLLFLLLSATAARNQAAQYALFLRGCSEADPNRSVRTLEEALAMDPSKTEILLHLASAHLAAGNAAAAKRIAAEIPEGDDHYHDAQAFLLGLSQFRATSSDSRTAVAPAVVPGSEYYFSLALGPDQAEWAADLLTQALARGTRTFDEGFRVRLLRAMRFYQMDNVESFDSETMTLAEMAPNSPVVCNLRGLAYGRRGRPTDALIAFSKAVRLNPSFATVYRNRGDIHNSLHQHQMAIADCDKAVAQDDELESFVRPTRINALVGLGRLDEAETQCARSHDTNEKNVDTYIACGELWLAKDVPDQAWSEFDLAVKLAQGPTSRRQHKYLSLRKRGGAATLLGRYQEAVQDLEEAEKQYPGGWQAEVKNYETRAYVYLLAEDTAKAIADLQVVAQSSEAKSYHYLWLWDAYLFQGRHADAAAALNKAAEMTDSGSWRLKIVDHCSGRLSWETLSRDAGDDLKKKTEAHYYAGLAAKARGDYQAAIVHFRTAQQTDSRQAESVLAQMQLSSLATHHPAHSTKE